MEWVKSLACLIGRVLLVLIFLDSAIGKIQNFEGTSQFMATYGMPYTSFFLFGAILLELVGGISVVLGDYSRVGALLLIIFLVPTTLIFHTDFADRTQMIMFMKNVSMCGGCLVLLGMGSGRFSLDYLLREREKKMVES